MKTDDKNKISIEQIAKYLSNEMEENEMADFEIEVALNQDNRVLLNEFEKEWKMFDSYKNRKRVDTGKAWNKLSARIASDENKEMAEFIERTDTRKFRWSYAAAILIAFIAIGAGLYLNSRISNSPQMVNMMNSSSGNTVVQSLADGSIIYLNNNTHFSYPLLFTGNSRKVSLKGEAFFDIARNPEKPFIIETNNAIVEVLGTAFNIKSYKPGKFELVVERGKVKVTLKSNPEESQIVVAGEKMDINNNHLEKSKWVDDGSLMWRIGKMQFKDETLATIVKVINSNYKTDISIPDKETANRRITVTFDNNSIDDILQLISLSMDLKTEQVGSQTVITDNNGK